MRKVNDRSHMWQLEQVMPWEEIVESIEEAKITITRPNEIYDYL